jgi:biotin-(acetyl-CoA carboxylase) ligase
MNDLAKREYKIGQKVLFLDEGQCEIRGIVRRMKDFDDRLELVIELDGGGYYTAMLRKRMET